MEASTRVGSLNLLGNALLFPFLLLCFGGCLFSVHSPLHFPFNGKEIHNPERPRTTAKIERNFEIQAHQLEKALHWKVGESPKAGSER